MSNARPRDVPRKPVNSSGGMSSLRSKEQRIHGAMPSVDPRKVTADRIRGIKQGLLLARQGKKFDREYLLNEIKKLPDGKIKTRFFRELI